jgi:hypothetical protein
MLVSILNKNVLVKTVVNYKDQKLLKYVNVKLAPHVVGILRLNHALIQASNVSDVVNFLILIFLEMVYVFVDKDVFDELTSTKRNHI